MALLGNQIARAILIRDTNRQIAQFVLSNPRITDTEILEFSKNANLDESVLRSIATCEEWMKHYSVKLGILSNPKTPVDISIKWIKYLQSKDLRGLAKSRGVPQVIVSQCRKLLETRQKHGE
jgi:hypothetical protein